jgi:hypothetical protein
MLRKEDKVEEGGKNIRGCENRCEDEFARRRKFAREKEESLRGRKRFTLLVDMERVMTLMFFQDFFFPGFLVCFFLRGDFCEEIFARRFLFLCCQNLFALGEKKSFYNLAIWE